MPRCRLAIYATTICLTPTHYWYSDNHHLRRRNLATNLDEEMHWFKSVIHEIKADAVRCVVDTFNPFDGHVLWMNRSKGWEVIAERVRRWYLTPERVIVTHMDEHITEACFATHDERFSPIRRRYHWIVNENYISWLRCNSRAEIRLERLLGVTVAAQLLNHA